MKKKDIASSRIRQLREYAKLTQADLAKLMDVSQGTISKWEEDFSQVSGIHIPDLCRYLGCVFEDLYEGNEERPAVKIIPECYKKFDKAIRLLRGYMANFHPPHEDKDKVYSVANLDNLVAKFEFKPTIVAAGRFDAGKSTLLNDFLGKDILPTGYQPTTRLVTWIIHSDHKPDWMKLSDVVVCNEVLDIRKLQDEALAKKSIITSGNIGLLEEFATKGGKHKDVAEAEFVIVFADSPLLKTCTLMDFPGFANEEVDNKRAEMVMRHADILLYMSPANGFFQGEDAQRLATFLRVIPTYEKDCIEMSTLGNVFFIISSAHGNIRGSHLEEIKEKACQRMLREFGDNVLPEYTKRSGRIVTADDLKARLFPYWREIEHRRTPLFDSLGNLCSSVMPPLWANIFNGKLNEFKNEGKYHFESLLTTWRRTLDNMEQARAELAQIDSEAPERDAKIRNATSDAFSKVSKYRSSCSDEISQILDEELRLDVLENMIKTKYKDKSEAQHYAVGSLMDQLHQKVTERCINYAKKLETDIETLVKSFDYAKPQAHDRTSVAVSPAFDARGAFLAGISSAGTVGALALWVGSLGNLGGYILVAKAAGWLATVGITFGASGAAGFVSFVALIGGPIVLAIGIGVLVGLGVKLLFGESWQTRLAKSIIKVAEKRDVKGQILTGVNKYWDETRLALSKGIDRMNEDHAKHIANLRKAVDLEGGVEATEAILREIERKRDFFVGLPMPQGQPKS